MCHFHLPAHTRLTELHFRTRDLDRALRFYTETLGFKIVERTESSAALSATGAAPALIRFTLDRDAAERQPNETGLSHFVIRLATRADLAQGARRLANQYKELRHGKSLFPDESMRVYDPDGTAIDLYHGSPELRIDHVSFTVKNLRSASRFFGDYLGLGTASKSEDSLSFTIGEADQRIEVTAREEAPRHAHNSVGLISYKIAVHCGEVLYALNQRGAIFGVESALGSKSSRSLQINDPFGFVLEVELVEAGKSDPHANQADQRNLAEHRNEMSLATKFGWKAIFRCWLKSFQTSPL